MELDGLPSTVMLPPDVTLTFDLLTPKANQHICEPKYICDQDWVKFPSLIFEIWCSQGFWDAQTHSLTYSTHGRTDLNTECLRHRFSTLAKGEGVKIEQCKTNSAKTNNLTTIKTQKNI